MDAPCREEERLEQGLAMLRSGDVGGGRAAVSEILRSRPGLADDLGRMGQALTAHERWEEAAALLEGALEERPSDPSLLNPLSVVCRKLGRIEDSIEAAERSLASEPGQPDALNNLGLALSKAGRLEDSAAAYRRALAADPRRCYVHYNLGLALSDLRLHEEALVAFDSALRLNRFFTAALLGLGSALLALGRPEEAREAFAACLARSPRDVRARILLGASFQKERRFEEAMAEYQRALEIDPRSVEARNNLGTALQGARRWKEARGVLAALVQAEPGFADGWANLGYVLGILNCLTEAESAVRRALGIRPLDAQSWAHLGFVMMAAGRVSEAVVAYRRAGELDPGFDAARSNEGVAQLLSGDFAPGWVNYESRHAKGAGNGNERFRERRRWRGERLEGQSILVHCEQGLGDALQFVRYLPLLAARGAEVHIEVHGVLKPLVEAMPGVHAAYAWGEPLPATDVHCPLVSLPLGFCTRLDTIPAPVPYLAPPPGLARAWQARLPRTGGRRIGVAWAGNPRHENDHNHSIPLATFEALFRAAPGDHFFSLQKEPVAADSARLPAQPNVTDLGPQLDSFGDTAAVISQLDLVIAVDTSVAHLAGALGCPVWVLLPFAPDWRWLLGRDDSPWYPSARLFRQPSPSAWESVLEEVSRSLAADRGAAATLSAVA